MNEALTDLASAAEELAGHHSPDGEDVYLSVSDMREFSSQVWILHGEIFYLSTRNQLASDSLLASNMDADLQLTPLLVADLSHMS